MCSYLSQQYHLETINGKILRGGFIFRLKSYLLFYLEQIRSLPIQSNLGLASKSKIH